MNRLLLTLGVAALLFSACKKGDQTTSAEEDLRSGTWRRTSGKVLYKDPISRSDSLRDYVLTDSLCRKDNSLNFKEGRIGYIDPGSVHCTPGEYQKEFTWEVSKDEKHISLYDVADYFPINDVDAEILTRTLGYLTIRYTVINADPIHSTYDTLVYTDVLRR
jgi:hypothetical protein